MSSVPSARRVVLVSFVVDVLDVVTNLVVALITGSAVVFAEMALGVADSIGSLMLVVGDRRSRRPRDAEHPLGYGREVFFWALLSAMTMLVLGGGLATWRAVDQLRERAEISHPWLALAVLAFALGTNAYAVGLSARKLRAEFGGLRTGLARGTRPLVATAFVRDVVGTTSSVLGLIAVGLYALTGEVLFDAIGALLVALLLSGGSLVLVAQARGLITGKALPAEDLERIRVVVLATEGVDALNRLVAVHAGAREVRIELDLDLDEELDTTAIEELLDELAVGVQRVVPGAEEVRVDLNSHTIRAGRAGPERGA